MLVMMVNSAFAYTYKCKAQDESQTMIVKDVPEGKQVILPLGHGEEISLIGKQSAYERVSNRADKFFYTLVDVDQNSAELTMVFMTRGGRFGNLPGKVPAFNYNTTLTYLGMKTLYACYTNYQD